MTIPFPKACPFCGVVTDVPHETQEGCIEALQAEIARIREILDQAKALSSRLSAEKNPESPDAR